MVEMAGVEPASKISPFVVIHKFIQFKSQTEKLYGYNLTLTVLLH